MESLSLIALLGIILAFALLLEPVARLIRLPFDIVLVVAGFVGSELALQFYDDLHIRWQDIHQIIIYILIPIFLFQLTIQLNTKAILKAWLPIAFLVIPLPLISALLMSVILYLFLGSSGFSWYSAFMAGILLSALSASAIPILRKGQMPDRLVAIMGCEGLFNSTLAIILFVLLTTTINISVDSFTFWKAGVMFVTVIVSGFAIGIVVGISLSVLMKITVKGYRHALITLIGCFVSYFLASSVFMASGAAAVLATSAISLWAMQRYGDQQSVQLTLDFWDYKLYLASASLHILMGISITINMINERWLAMLMAIFAVLVVRGIVVYGFLPVLNRLPKADIHRGWYPVLFWGNLRSGTTIALALAIPTSIDGWWTIQAMVYGMVFFSLAVQESTLPRVIEYSKKQAS